MEQVKPKESWNKKRIIAALILIGLLVTGAYFFKDRILGMNLPFQKANSVKGVTVKEESIGEKKIDIDMQAIIKEKLEELKNEALKIDVSEIASSSPQIKKLIKDLGSIKDYPSNQAKEICEKVCGNL